jgi:hypothetical protein
MWGALSDGRTGLSCTIAAGPLQRRHSRVRVPRDSRPYFTVSNSWFPKQEGQIPVFVLPRHRVVQLYSQAPDSLFVASYDSQGYDGGIRTRLQEGYKYEHRLHNIYKWSSYFTENLRVPRRAGKFLVVDLPPASQERLWRRVFGSLLNNIIINTQAPQLMSTIEHNVNKENPQHWPTHCYHKRTITELF